MYFVVLKRNSAGITTENKAFIQHKSIQLFADSGSIFFLRYPNVRLGISIELK